LKARGHPVGATGVYQIVEVVQQLKGEAGETQVPDARIGMAQNIGGSGATIVTHIMKSIHKQFRVALKMSTQREITGWRF
jgi:acetyl-CoA C-acetyltransferase